jgi:hypothetical protein
VSHFDTALRELRAALDADHRTDTGIALWRAAQIARTVTAAAERGGHLLPEVRHALRTIEIHALALQTGMAAEQVDSDLPPWPPAGWTGDDPPRG